MNTRLYEPPPLEQEIMDVIFDAHKALDVRTGLDLHEFVLARSPAAGAFMRQSFIDMGYSDKDLRHHVACGMKKQALESLRANPLYVREVFGNGYRKLYTLLARAASLPRSCQFADSDGMLYPERTGENDFARTYEPYRRIRKAWVGACNDVLPLPISEAVFVQGLGTILLQPDIWPAHDLSEAELIELLRFLGPITSEVLGDGHEPRIHT